MNWALSIFRPSLGKIILENIAVVRPRNFSLNHRLLICRPCQLQSCMMLQTASTTSTHSPNFSHKRIWASPEKQNCYIFTQIRMSSSGFMQSLKTKLGWPKKMKYPKYKLVETGYKLYMCAVEVPDYVGTIEHLQIPDTYYSWYLLSELHVWMVLVRLSTCDEEGKFARGQLMKAFWSDIKKRSSKVGTSPSRQEELQLLNYHFNSAIFSYDEGLLSDDRVLANSLWRIFFEKQITDPQLLELMVQYVRKQIKHLDDQTDDDILRTGLISFLPLNSDVENIARTKKIWKRVKESVLIIR